MSSWSGFVAAALVITTLAGRDVAAQSVGYRELFGASRTIGHEAEFAMFMGMSLFNDGSALVLDFMRKDLTRIDADGKIIWRYGRTGGGPGEFIGPYRFAVMPDQSTLVFDLYRPNAATRISEAGKFVEQLRIDFPVNVNGALALSTGEIVIAGTTSDARGRDAALHLFTGSLQYIRSFGPLPEAPRELVNLSGVAAPTVGKNDEIVYTRRYPYEVYAFDKSGNALAKLSVPREVSRMEEQTLRQQNGGRLTFTHNPKAFGPKPANDLGNGWLLTGRNNPERSMDIFDRRGTVLGSFNMSGRENVAAIDYARKRFWMFAEEDDVPVLRVVEFGPGLR